MFLPPVPFYELQIHTQYLISKLYHRKLSKGTSSFKLQAFSDRKQFIELEPDICLPLDLISQQNMFTTITPTTQMILHPATHPLKYSHLPMTWPLWNSSLTLMSSCTGDR